MATPLASARITDHARTAMRRRGGVETQVREVLRAPQGLALGDRPGRRVAQGLVTLGEPPLGALLRVVVDVDRDPPEVVTVHATTPFRRYGASP